MENYAERVAKGVEWLDSVEPNWRNMVDPEKLSMWSPYWCILGQVFGNYWRVAGNEDEECGCEFCSVPTLYDDEVIDFGFNYLTNADEYKHLESEWLKVLSV